MLCAGTICGSNQYYLGKITNLSVNQIGANDYILTWSIKNPAQQFLQVIQIDGEVLDTVATDIRSYRFSLSDTDAHNINITLVDDHQITQSPTILGETAAYRAFLRWDASKDSTVRSYRIYGDSGTGTIDYLTPLATVTAPQTASIQAVYGTLNGGRVSTLGQSNKTDFNGSLQIEITGSGTARRRYNTDDWTSFDFAEGEQVYVDGLFIHFIDPVSSYITGETWEIPIGIRTYWISDVLETGYYQFHVKAVDAAGNENEDFHYGYGYGFPAGLDYFDVLNWGGEGLDVYGYGTPTFESTYNDYSYGYGYERQTNIITLYVKVAGDTITNKSAVYDLEDDETTVSWTNPDDAAFTGTNIYCNYDKLTSRLTDYILEDAPYSTVLSPQTSLTVSTPDDGDWLFRIIPSYSDKPSPFDLELVKVNVGYKSSNINLTDPYNISFTYGAAGQTTLTFDYDYLNGSDLDGFGIYLSNDSETVLDAGNYEEITPTLVSGSNFRKYSYNLGNLSETKYIVLVACNLPHFSGDRTVYTITPDNDNPEFGGRLYGASV